MVVFQAVGSGWTAEHKRVAFNGAIALPHMPDGASLCDPKLYNWPNQFAFMYNKWGIAGANALARECARRSHHYVNTWLWQDDERYEFIEEDHDEYEETEEWLECVTSIDVSQEREWEKIEEIRAMRPVLRPKK